MASRSPNAARCSRAFPGLPGPGWCLAGTLMIIAYFPVCSVSLSGIRYCTSTPRPFPSPSYSYSYCTVLTAPGRAGATWGNEYCTVQYRTWGCHDCHLQVQPGWIMDNLCCCWGPYSTVLYSQPPAPPPPPPPKQAPHTGG